MAKRADSKFVRDVVKAAPLILGGRTVVLDPSSGSKKSFPGIVVAERGKIVRSGVIVLDSNLPIQQRLMQLYRYLDNLEPADVLIIERIRGTKAHEYLHWAVGVSVAALNTKVLLEIPTTVWKQVARTVKSYIKGDESDALMMFKSVLNIINERAIHGTKGYLNSRTNTKFKRCHSQTKRSIRTARS